MENLKGKKIYVVVNTEIHEDDVLPEIDTNAFCDYSEAVACFDSHVKDVAEDYEIDEIDYTSTNGNNKSFEFCDDDYENNYKIELREIYIS